MSDIDDADLDPNLLEVLLQAEKSQENDSLATESKAITPSKLNAGEKQRSFGSILEDLDCLPVKKAAHQEVGINPEESNETQSSKSAVHTGDTDSSDDDDNRRYGHQADDYGSMVKKLLDADRESRTDVFALVGRKESSAHASSKSTWKSGSLSSSSKSQGTLCLPSKKPSGNFDVYTDPHVGIRIINPLVSSTVIKERLLGRRVVSFTDLKQVVSEGKPSNDWVIFGVIVSKLPPKTSSKGSLYSIIKLSDIKGPGTFKTVSVFLFSQAFKGHSKETVGTVLGILNPGVLDDSKTHHDEACLSVDNPDKIMVLGTSKDFGMCRSKKKNGDNCLSIVNTAQCEYCVYHVKQEYVKCSRRSDIQSSFNGSGLQSLRNKVLGKSEVFYAGQSYSAVPAKKSKKLVEKDQRRLQALLGKGSPQLSLSTSGVQKKIGLAASLDLSHQQAKRDAERLRKLKVIESDSSSPNAVFPFKSEELKLNDAKQAALTLVTLKKDMVKHSDRGEHNEITLQDPSKGLSDTFPKESAVSVADVPGKVINASVSRGAAITQARTKSSDSLITPSDLGLGCQRPTKESNSQESMPHARSVHSVAEKACAKKTTCHSNAEKKVPIGSQIKDSLPLNSKQLLKISTGMNMESRLLKKAAQKTAEREHALTLGTSSTPSMLGLGRSSVSGRLNNSPTLGYGLHNTSIIDLDTPVVKRSSQAFIKRTSQAAKLRAISLLQKGGGLQKEDPNFREFETRKKLIKPSLDRKRGVKRPFSDSSDNFSHGSKRSAESQEKENADKMARFKELMERTSSHTDLVEAAENVAQEDYFGKLEKKEQLEEKMLNTFKVSCKAVRCLLCKYTSFSASEHCKTERHPLKILDATKRFWKCGDCGNRTVSLELIPLKSCSNCNSSRWERAPMIRERKVGVSVETLSIRGLEEKFVGSVTTGGNINLLVPEEGS